MEAHNVYVDTTQVAGVVPATNVETVALVLPANVSVPQGIQIIVEAFAAFTTGTGTAAVIGRIRKGAAVGGALLGAAFPIVAGAGVNVSLSGQVGDVSPEYSGAQYCLTLQQTSGTGNGSALYASIQASWIS